MLTVEGAGSATCTVLALAGGPVLPVTAFPPQFHFLSLGALDAQLFHLRIVLYFRFREMSVLAEDYVETQSDKAQGDKNKGCEKDFHPGTFQNRFYRRWKIGPMLILL